MAERFDNLYSVGPGSVGPGTHVTQSRLDPERNRGTVTRMYKNDAGISVEQLANLYTLSTPTFPNTSIILDSTYVRQLSNTLALVVSRYGRNSRGGGFRTVFQMSPNGARSRRFYNLRGDYLSDPNNKDDNGKPKPIFFPQGLTTIKWSSVVYQDIRPARRDYLIGRFNVNSYRIDGYSHAPGTLRYDGQWITHQKWGGYDRWVIQHSVTHDPTGWNNDNIRLITTETSSRWEFADETPEYDSRLLVRFPNMP